MDGDPKSSADVLATRPNGRGAAPLIVDKEARKPLFSNKSTKENTNAPSTAETRPGGGRYGYYGANARPRGGSTRPSSSGSQTPSLDRSSSTGELASPGSRIPRPKSAVGVFSKARRPISLTEAYRMAEAEEGRAEQAERARKASPAGIDLSPSPAPRPHLSRHESDEGRMRKMLSRGPLDFGRTRRLSRQSSGSLVEEDTRRSTESLGSQKSGSTTSDFDRKLSQYEQEQGQSPSSPRRRSGLFGKSKIGPKVAETGQALAKKTSSSSLNERPREAFSNGHVPKGWIKRFMSIPDKDDGEESSPKDGKVDWEESDADVPLPSVEPGNTPQEPTPPSSRPASANLDARSPEKSYHWLVDADFTAGDLQVSDSPRIKMGNTRSDELLSRKLSNDAAFGDNQGIDIGSAGSSLTTRGARASSSDRLRSVSSNTKLDEIRQREIDADREFEIQAKIQPKPTNTKLDEIRAREMEYLSKRALATSRLEEIREQNFVSRSLSPEVRSQRSREFARETTPSFDPEIHQRTIIEEEEKGEQIPNTPITIFRKPTTDKDAKSETDSQGDAKKDSRSSSSSRPSISHSRGDSRDLLRRLARAASTSPAPATSGESVNSNGKSDRALDEDSDKKSIASRHSSNDDQKVPTPEIKEPDKSKPTVGFAGLRRQRSTDSAKEKRSSRALSDNDPTERIEGEMSLFAPMENHSERGSVRAPSPDSSDEDDDDDERNPVEETPRAPKRDPLSLPTPRVTGAYVDTPMVVKPERLEERFKASSDELPSTVPAKASSSGRRGSDASSQASKSISSESGTESRKAKDFATTTTGTFRRRARSLPRSRQPLINTAKLPTVKDDLLAIQRTHQIEDSTLDDFDELFSVKHAPSPEIESILSNIPTKREETAVAHRHDKSEPDSELERYDRMSKSLKDGLLGIRTAKQGIERLEDKVAHSENPAPRTDHEHHDHTQHCPTCAAQASPSSLAYVHVPVPRLFHHKPFRVTFFGLLLFVFSFWYAAETAMCDSYCRPQVCSSTPCIWSFDDPTWGTAIPVKLDQWFANGWGRQQANQWGEEIWDMYAEAIDFVTGTDITEVDIKTLGFYEKRQHRRRLRKKGLSKPRVEPPEHKAKWDAWHETRLAKERAREAKEMGYDTAEGDETFGDDERIR